MYGSPPQELIDVAPEDIEDTTPTMLEAMKNGERSRRAAIQESKRASAECGDDEGGEQGDDGVSRLPDSATPQQVRADGAEGSDIGEAGEGESSSDSVRVEAREDGDADVSVSGVASEVHQETL